MGKVIFENSISLDGFVAGPNAGADNSMGDGGMRLFDWGQMGDVEFVLPGSDYAHRVSRASADFMSREWLRFGAIITGRRTFENAHAWEGHPPGDVPCFVVSHSVVPEWVKEGSPFTFVTDGVASAVRQAQATAGDRDVSIGSASIAQQCLSLGLLDELILDLVPIVLGAGVRLFNNVGATPIDMEVVETVVGTGVTHLKLRVVK